MTRHKPCHHLIYIFFNTCLDQADSALLCERFIQSRYELISIKSVYCCSSVDGLTLRSRAANAHHAVSKESADQFRMLADNVSDDHILCNHLNELLSSVSLHRIYYNRRRSKASDIPIYQIGIFTAPPLWLRGTHRIPQKPDTEGNPSLSVQWNGTGIQPCWPLSSRDRCSCLRQR